MKNRWDGSVQSSNAPVYSKTGIPRDDFAVYRCLVTEVLYVDDDKNISKKSPNPEVLYGVVILGGSSSGQTLSNCRLAAYLNGERTLKATTKNISKDKLSDHDGDVVLVQFIQGHDAYPSIIGFSRNFHDTTGAKKSDGPRLLDYFNGFTTNINNNGEYTRSMNGGSTSNGVFKAGSSSIIKEVWSKDEKLTRTYQSGLTVVEDGKSDKMTLTTSGGAVVSVDGKGMLISIKAGATEVDIDGNSGKITLKGQAVDLGASVSDFVTMFTQLSTAWATHTHMYSPGPSPPVPSGPPMAPLLTTVGSQSVKVQS